MSTTTDRRRLLSVGLAAGVASAWVPRTTAASPDATSAGAAVAALDVACLGTPSLPTRPRDRRCRRRHARRQLLGRAPAVPSGNDPGR